METTLVASASSANSTLQLTTTKKGVIWLDQVSAMPEDTFKVCVPSWIYYYTQFLYLSLLVNIQTCLGTGTWFPSRLGQHASRVETSLSQISRYA